MPFAGFANFAACIADQRSKGKDLDSAKKICGKLQAKEGFDSIATPESLSDTVTLQESTLSSRVDEDAGVIRNVKILGLTSKNGRIYSVDAIREAQHLYDGVKVYIDHPVGRADRPYVSGFGEIRNPSVKESSGLYGDLYYNTRHPQANQIAEDARRFPTNFGLSHNAEGTVARKGGKLVVDKINYVESVDIVGRPATNKSLFESYTGSESVKKSVDRIVKDVPSNTPGLVGLLEQMEDGTLAPTDIVDMPAPDSPSEPVDPQEQVKAAIKAAIIAAFEDPTLDIQGTLAQIKKILKAHEDIVGPVGPDASPKSNKTPADTAGDTGPETPAEDKEKDKTIESLQRKVRALEILESVKVPSSSVKVKALIALDTEREMRQLAESWSGGSIGSGRPAQSAAAYGRGGSFDAQVAGENGFAKAVTGR